MIQQHSFISFDGQPIAVNDIVHQMSVLPDGTVQIWELQVLELMPNGKLRLHHLGSDNQVKQFTVLPKIVAKSPKAMLEGYIKELITQQEKIPAMLTKAREVLDNPAEHTLRTTKIETYTDIIAEI